MVWESAPTFTKMEVGNRGIGRLANHRSASQRPNTHFGFTRNNVLVLIADEPIKNNQEIFIDYNKGSRGKRYIFHDPKVRYGTKWDEYILMMKKCWNVGMLEFRQSPIGEIKIVFIKKEKKNYRNSLSEVQHSNIPTFFPSLIYIFISFYPMGY